MGHYSGRNNTDHIREEIYHTQEQLRQKCSALGGEVRSVVQHTQEMLSKRVHEAQETVDIARHVRRHPLVCCGVALALGYVIGARRRSRRVGLSRMAIESRTEQAQEHDRIMQVITPEKPSVWNALAFMAVEIVGEIVKRRFLP